MDLPNPYEAPSTAILVSGEPPAPVVRRSRWATLRLIPFLYFGFQVLLAPIVVAGTGIDLVATLVRDGAQAPPPELVYGLLQSVGSILVGVPSFFIARAWAYCQWRRAFTYSAIFFVVVGAAVFLAGQVSD